MDVVLRRRGSPGGPGPGAEPAAPARVLLDRGRRYHLWCLDAGLACCAVEFVAALARDDLEGNDLEGDDRPGPGVPAGAGEPERVDVLVVSGTVTDALAPAVLRLHEQMPSPKHVVSFGSCANTGGPYWDSYCVTKGVDQLLEVDAYVPGCPPRPEALLQGLRRLSERLAAP